MPPKRRVIELDEDDDPEIVEVHAIPRPPGPRAPRAPRMTRPPPRANDPRPAPGYVVPAPELHFFKVLVATTMDDSFFPDRALKLIADLRHHETQAVMQAYESNIPIVSRYKYTIVSETTTDSSNDLSSHRVAPSSPSQTYINAQLLQLFLVCNPRLTSMAERPKFVWLRAIPGVKNPRFAHLHSVRYDEVGFGFDEDNCLSLFLSELVDGVRHTKVWYVSRTESEDEPVGKSEEDTGVRGVKEEGVEADGMAA